jgi:hypothetical protein
VQRLFFLGLALAAEFLAARRVVGWIVSALVRGAAALLTLLTPHAAADLKNEPPRHGLRILVWATLLAGLVISLGGNAIFTWVAGTFWGDAPRRYYYYQDWHNLVLYAFVAPIYMAASAAIIYCALSSFSLTGRDASNTGVRLWPVLRLGFVLSWIVLLAGVVQVNYYRENILGIANIADPANPCFGRIYWFVEEVRKDGKPVLSLNAAGVYYLCMQFCHMAVIAAAVWFMATAMFTLYRLGVELTADYLARHGGAEPVRNELARFSLLEVSAKVLALILTVHIRIWGDSCLRGGHNIYITGMFLLALQFFVLATPRLLIEYKLLKCAEAENPSSDSTISWPDLVDQRDRWKSTLVGFCHFLVQLLLLALGTDLVLTALRATAIGWWP